MASDCLVTVVMALYRPNIKWLTEELLSIQQQTFQNFQVYVWNDDPDDTYDYHQLFLQCLKGIPFKIFHGLHNMGSNKVFEKLTSLVTTPYIAYCDQDDIWHSDKISILLALLDKQNGTLACSDMRVIDGDGNVLCNKITDIRPRQTFVAGTQQIKTLLIRNFVTGCTVIASTSMAKKAIPFPVNIVHDHWLALWNAIFGKIVISYDSLIDYRLHGDNQTSVLAGISTKKDYYQKRSLMYYQRMCEFSNIDFGFEINAQISQNLKWATKRVEYLKKPTIKKFLSLGTFLRCNFCTTFFEMFLPLMPMQLFSYVIKIIREGKI